MHEVSDDIQHWLQVGETVLLATVVSTWGSSPRIPGAKMAFTPSGKVSGSVSGGCVENAVIVEGLEALKHDQPVFLHYGVADETALEVGLACGGKIDIFVQKLDADLFVSIKRAMEQMEPVALVTVIQAAKNIVGLQAALTRSERITSSLPDSLLGVGSSLAHEAFDSGEPARRQIETELGSVELFADPILPPPTIFLIGGAHISLALARLAKTAGFQTVVIDPRKVFGSPERFPDAGRLIQDWPEEAFRQSPINASSAIVMLTHDPKIDDPALIAALNSPAFYIGALGSSKTQEQRRQRMLEAGFLPEQLRRIHGPVGINLGARLPEEIAVSILAEIIAVHRKVRE